MPAGDQRPPTPWRQRTASGVVATAMAVGLRSALDDDGDVAAIVVTVPGDAHDPGAALELHFDARGPADTWAVARPWLLPHR